jgi:SAM-dependent methyltransferase
LNRDLVRPYAARNAWFWKVAERVPQLMEIRESAADIGSGDGHFCADLRAAGWPNVTGIEISRTRVARARQLYPNIPFYSCSLGEAGIPEDSLDLIVMDSVIEHLPRPINMVEELRRYLAPGGTLVILTPNMESGHFRFLGHRWTGMLAPHAHIFLFTGSGLAQMLTRCGLAISAIGSLQTPAYRPSEYARRLFSGDIKGTLWRAHQELGGAYGRLIGAGPMLYAVASRPR